MKEAIGNSYLVILSIVLISLVAAILVASFVHTKAYKVKNKVLTVLEKHGGYTTRVDDPINSTEADIYTDLSAMGFKVVSEAKNCPSLGKNIYDEEIEIVHKRDVGNYDYCLYDVPTSRGHYYHILVYTHYDIPIIGQFLTYPISGDSRTLYSELKG